MTCPLCLPPKQDPLYQNEKLYIIFVHDEPKAPAFCRVIWKAHVKEMTDLPETEQHELMKWVFKTEQAMRSVLKPTKINLASLGNQVAHLHWHIIARFENDSCFPDSIWAPARNLQAALTLPELWENQVRQRLNT